jgi:predicted alpha-1,6-mannanase (GH76 family)
MLASLSDSAAGAVQALQQWYGADFFADSAGLYHWDDPDIAHDLQSQSSIPGAGSIAAAALVAAGYRDAYQDMTTWWHSANAITALIDYMSVTKDYTYLWVIDNTFTLAPANAWQPNLGEIAGWTAVAVAAGAALGALLCGPPCAVLGGLLGSLLGSGGSAGISIGRNYMTNFYGSDPLYDDAGWWALAWIKAYDLTNEQKYLDMAAVIFQFMTGGWDDGTCNGGLWWQQNHKDSKGNSPYKNAIANELFLAVAAALCLRYTRSGRPSSNFLYWAQDKEWPWFQRSGLINGSNLINDSLSTSNPGPPCINDGSQDVWTYNQGVILGALCDLFDITGDKSLLEQAECIADAVIRNQVVTGGHPSQSGVNHGILTEYNDNNPSYDEVGIDARQFKGIFIRNLAQLWARGGHQERYRTFILRNAASALKFMNSSYQFGASWSAPVDTADFVRQSSAIDLLNAALLVQHRSADLSYLTPLLLQRTNAADLSYLTPLLLP